MNAFDSEAKVSKYLTDNKFTFKVVLGGEGANYAVGKAYGVQAYPTNYLVDADGKILWRSVGFDEAGLRAALEKAGIRK